MSRQSLKSVRSTCTTSLTRGDTLMGMVSTEMPADDISGFGDDEYDVDDCDDETEEATEEDERGREVSADGC